MKIFVDMLPGQGTHDRVGPGGAGNKWRYDVSAGRRELSVSSWLHRPLLSGTHDRHTVMLLNIFLFRLVLSSELSIHMPKMGAISHGVTKASNRHRLVVLFRTGSGRRLLPSPTRAWQHRPVRRRGADRLRTALSVSRPLDVM